MPLDEMDKMKKEIASSSDDNHQDDPRMPEVGYFYLAQQINTLMQMQNEFRNSIELRFDNLRQETKADIKVLRDELKGDISELKTDFNGMKTWYIGTVVGIVGIIVTLIGLILSMKT